MWSIEIGCQVGRARANCKQYQKIPSPTIKSPDPVALSSYTTAFHIIQDLQSRLIVAFVIEKHDFCHMLIKRVEDLIMAR